MRTHKISIINSSCYLSSRMRDCIYTYALVSSIKITRWPIKLHVGGQNRIHTILDILYTKWITNELNGRLWAADFDIFYYFYSQISYAPLETTMSKTRWETNWHVNWIIYYILFIRHDNKQDNAQAPFFVG